MSDTLVIASEFFILFLSRKLQIHVPVMPAHPCTNSFTPTWIITEVRGMQVYAPIGLKGTQLVQRIWKLIIFFDIVLRSKSYLKF